MITLNNIKDTAQISLSVITLIVLIIYELGNKKIKRILLPFVIALVFAFLIMAGIKIYSMAV